MKLQWIFIGLMLMFIASACSKDALTTKDEAPILKKAEIPVINEFTIYLDHWGGTYNKPFSGRVEGIVSHLGKLESGEIVDAEMDQYTGSYWHDSDPILSEDEMTIAYNDDWAYFVAPNGDILKGLTVGTIYLDPKLSPSGKYNFEGTFSYKGGTGRFANASGEGKIYGIFTSVDQYKRPYTMQLTVEGWITDVGKNKKK